MSDYPYGPESAPPANPPPVQPRSELPRSTAIWSWLCLASLGLAGLFFLYGKHLAMSPLPRGAWFDIVDGLVAWGGTHQLDRGRHRRDRLGSQLVFGTATMTVEPVAMMLPEQPPFRGSIIQAGPSLNTPNQIAACYKPRPIL
jgi:hypothetical protein